MTPQENHTPESVIADVALPEFESGIVVGGMLAKRITDALKAAGFEVRPIPSGSDMGGITSEDLARIDPIDPGFWDALAATKDVVDPPEIPKDSTAAREDLHDALRSLIPDLASRNAAIDRIQAPAPTGLVEAPQQATRPEFDPPSVDCLRRGIDKIHKLAMKNMNHAACWTIEHTAIDLLEYIDLHSLAKPQGQGAAE